MKPMFTPETLHEVQLMLEQEMFDGGVRRFEADNQRHMTSGTASQTAWNRRLLSEFIAPLAEGVGAYKQAYTGKRGRPSRALSYLNIVADDVAAYITLKVVMDSMCLDVTYQAIAVMVADRIEDQCRFTKLEGAAEKYMEKVKDSLKRNSSKQYKHGHRVMVAAEKRIADNGDTERWIDWPITDRVQIGMTLLEIMENSLFFRGEPVFSRVMRGEGVKTTYFLQPSELVGEWVQEFREHVAQLAPNYAPCVVPPRPWYTAFNGGFHTEAVASRVNLVKGDREHLRRLTRKQMPKVYQAVNGLQNTKWAVNEKVLAVMEDVVRLNLGYGMPSMSPLISRDNRPANPVPLEYQHLRGQELKDALTTDQWAVFLAWKGECSKLYTAETKRGSKAASVVRLIGQARKYSEYPALYFVYALDSRGRVYPQSSVLSPQANDIGKSLLQFANGRPVADAEAFRWFCVNGANLWGWDKKTFDVRVTNVLDEEFQELCKDIASDPLTFTQWAGADAPYEFLAWAFEYAEYLEMAEEGRLSEFLSYLPAHMDGSCSGIQHYSAMLRDAVGAKAVNLLPSDTPQDIYGAVAQVAIGKNNKVAAMEDGDQFISGSLVLEAEMARAYASAWDAVGITRSLTKKPVMTLPYGSTRITCRESVSDYLIDLEEKEFDKAKADKRSPNPVHPFSVEGDSPLKMKEALNYMTSLVWPSISEVVKAPVVAMKFIRQLARKVSKMNQGMEWVTPTGFIVKQEIYATDLLRVNTALFGSSRVSVQVETDLIDEAGMMGAAAPNFVHSYDASHLILTVCALLDADVVDIAVIHDSFGTHAAGTVLLRVCLRGEMVSMYIDRNALEELLSWNEDRLKQDMEIEIPEQGDFDLNMILQSDYAFA